MIRKFKAPSMQEAMKLAKDFFGDEAVVLQSRKVKDRSLAHTDDDELVEITVTSEKHVKQARQQANRTARVYTPADARRQVKKPPTTPVASDDRKMAEIKRELLQLKSAMDSLREDIRRSHMNVLPDTYRLLEQDKGFDPDVAAELVQNVFLKLEGTDIRDDARIKEVLHLEITRGLSINNRLELLSGRPKMLCLVGPTGMGKTTSIIKLATHPEFYGSKRVGLITIDTYRVAAAAQLKTFAALAKIPLEIVYEPADFGAAVDRLRDREVILVDTAGRSPLNDEHLADLRQFFAVAMPDEIHLVLSVSMRSDNLVAAASNFSSLPVSNIIVSKIDETVRLGNIFNVGRKIDLPLSFLTNGQKVPDDIQLAEKSKIANLILN